MPSAMPLLLSLFVGVARAQEPAAPPDRVDVDPFTPAASLALGFGSMQGESPFLGAEGLSLALHSSVAENPAVFRYAQGGETPIVSDLLMTEVAAGWTLNDRVRIDLAVPFYPYVKAPWQGKQGPAMGDIRVQGTIPLVGEPGDAFAFALVPRIGAPTGTRWSYTRRGVHGSLLAAAGGDVGRWGWVSNAGFTFSGTDKVEGITTGSTFDLLGGGWFLAQDGFRLGADVSASFGLASGRTGHGNSRGEVDLFAQSRLPNGFGLTVGGGTGLIGGIGAPDWRMFASITYGLSVRDSDGDGLNDDVDSCPIDAEDFDSWQDEDGCPEADNDSDGYVDTSDGCPNVAEDDDDYENDGCPEFDNDGDTVLDVDDLCPLVQGAVDFRGCPDTDKDGLQDAEDQCPQDAGPKVTGGCPDRDEDLVPDFRDKCPDEKRPMDEDPAFSDGCPKRVYMTAKAVKITEKVFFETNKATIKPESFGLLDDVATVMGQATWVTRIEVDGHTDDKGADAANLTLSQKRAQSVVDYLVKKGVTKERLVAKGFGEVSPIDTNRTEDGRQNNRRVEFVILEQDASKMPKASGSPQVKPAEVKPAEVKPAEVKPAEVKPAEVKPAEVKPAEVIPGTLPATVEPTVPKGPPAAPGTPGKLTINLAGVGWADVYVDDVKIAKTAPFKDLTITAGQHLVVVVNNRSGFTYEQTITVEPGAAVVINASKGGTPPAAPVPTPDAPWGPLPQ